MQRKLYLFLSFIIVASFVLAACGSPAPAPQAPPKLFVPLPPPVNGFFGTTLNYNAGVGSQTSKLVSPFFELNYEETASGPGGTASERLWHLPTGKVGIMRETNWGDYLGGKLTVVEFYDSQQCLVQGMVVLEVRNATLWQWLFRGISRTFDRGEVNLVYQVDEPCGQSMRLTKIQYGERWGTSENDIIAMGATALWDNPMTVVPAQYHNWGFWETSITPFDIVANAIDSVRQTLQVQAEVPNLFIVDQDSLREVIGRQTGLTYYRNGVQIGQVILTYRNTFGRMPNTNLIGTGALSRIEYVFDDGRYYAWVMLTPQVSPVPSTLMVLTTSKERADMLENAADWVSLYPRLRAGEFADVKLAFHMIGDLRVDTTNYSANVQGGEGGSVSGTIRLGTSGGIAYALVAEPKHEDVALGMSLLNALGKSGLDAIGHYFPYKPGSGTGAHYYLSIVLIATAPDALRMDYPGLDIGAIDRVGFPDLEVFDGFAPSYLSESFESPWHPVAVEETAVPEVQVEDTPAP
jgi:hypothetical protein